MEIFFLLLFQRSQITFKYRLGIRSTDFLILLLNQSNFQSNHQNHSQCSNKVIPHKVSQLRPNQNSSPQFT